MGEKDDYYKHVAFNHDSTRFVCACNDGVEVYDCDPLKLAFGRNPKLAKGLAIAEMEDNLRLFLLGGGKFPLDDNKRVVIWDEVQGRISSKSYNCASQVLAIKVSGDAVAIVMQNKVELHVYVKANETSRIYSSVTTCNLRGVCALSPGYVLAIPGLSEGEVRIHAAHRHPFSINAHANTLSCLALSQNGRFLATASVKGTVVKIYSISTGWGEKLQELRRGKDKAEIWSMAFSPDNHWLALTSDKCTIHVFKVNVPDSSTTSNSSTASNHEVTATNPTSSLSFMRGVLPSYFSSQWSFAQFQLKTKSHAVVTFSSKEPYTILVACRNSTFYKLKFDPAFGGTMKQEKYCIFPEV
ncbi:hypothetical protein SELMODRAFT_426221 [Selaginella moellendorffii]|uniref:Anaphase-promoting complex subunit 4 WD40 domain-containing protein n=1 Tax=Selaginella moellendorffii TaxID=88036 RepID=D8SVQ8_SELML|nr:hypothetical protein SELMODRAFT_426221 [Selaginella moellendorffii]